MRLRWHPGSSQRFRFQTQTSEKLRFKNLSGRHAARSPSLSPRLHVLSVAKRARRTVRATMTLRCHTDAFVDDGSRVRLYGYLQGGAHTRIPVLALDLTAVVLTFTKSVYVPAGTGPRQLLAPSSAVSRNLPADTVLTPAAPSQGRRSQKLQPETSPYADVEI